MSETSDMSATRVKNFDFDNDTRVKTFFHTLIFTIWQVKDYKERNNFIVGTTFWKMSRFNAKMRLKSAPQKTKLFNCKSYTKILYTRL